jgi:hypothetical protein
MMAQPTASSTPDLSPRQQRILTWMKDGNRIFEVVGKKYFTLYEDKTDRDHRIRKDELEELERSSVISQVPNPDRNRLDAWEISEFGRSLIATFQRSR